jgi:hypothetical protein
MNMKPTSTAINTNQNFAPRPLETGVPSIVAATLSPVSGATRGALFSFCEAHARLD